MFWVEQGRAVRELDLSAENRGALMGALESEVGQVLGGDRGRALRDAVGAQYRAYFTEQGRPKAALSDAISAADALEADVRQRQAQLQQYDGKVDQLARTRERLRDFERDRRLDRAKSELRSSTEKLQLIEELRRQSHGAEQAVRLAEAEERAPTAAVAQRDALIARERNDRGESGRFARRGTWSS